MTRAVFLSYRREEARHIAGRLADRLTDRLGSTKVFMDVDTVEPGADFAAAIAQAVGSCEVLIVLIGPSWSTIADQRGRRRLDDPDDFVVLEIRAALEREIRVIPVLVDGAVMPNRYDLPEGLQGIARRNAVRIDHETFRSDAAILIDAVERILSTLGQKSTEPAVRTGTGVAGLSAMGDHEWARELDEYTLTRRRVLSQFAADLRELGHHKWAHELDEFALTRSRRVLGDDHPDTLTSASNLAVDLRKLGDHERARELDEETLIRRRSVLGDDHPDTLTSASNLAVDLRKLGDHKRARQLDDWIRSQRES